MPHGPAHGRARRALRADLLAAAWRTSSRGIATPISLATTAASRAKPISPVAGAARRPRAARVARRHARHLGRRVRTPARLAKRRQARARSQSARLHRLARRRRGEGRRPLRRDRRDRPPGRRGQSQRARLPRHAARALGLDHEKLTFPFQGLDQRLTGVEPARVVHEIFA